MFDEPSSYLDVRQRIKAAQAIRRLIRHDRYVIVVEHDLSILDYLSDYICCLYGSPGKVFDSIINQLNWKQDAVSKQTE